ncbi:MAG: hypothetical protein ACW98D_17960, partial [Promethearchaeota archaeon]
DALTGMTLTEIEEKYGDIAVGRYQIIGETRRGLIENLGLDPDTFIYNEENQDLLGTELLKEKGLEKWLSGEMDNEAFLGEIATVWRGLPMDKSGKGFEEGDQFGNAATISYDEAIAFMGGENLQEPKKNIEFKEQTSVEQLYDNIAKLEMEKLENKDIQTNERQKTVLINELNNLNAELETAKANNNKDKVSALNKDIKEIQDEIILNYSASLNIEKAYNEKYQNQIMPKLKAIKEELKNKYLKGEISKDTYEKNINILNTNIKELELYSENLNNFSSALDVALRADIDAQREIIGSEADANKYASQQLAELLNMESINDYYTTKYAEEYNNYLNEYMKNKKGEAKEYIDEINASFVKNITEGKGVDEINFLDLSYGFGEYKQEDKEDEVVSVDDEIELVKADQIDKDVLDVTTVDNETLAREQNSQEKIDKLGLRGLVEKYGGVDMALQASGMLAGYMAASGDVPIQQKSALWQERMSQLRDRTQLGLDNKSKTLLQRQAERTYASDVTNIGRMAPSGQSALGALGTASARKYDADLKMGAIDADMRARNEEIYQSALAQDEALTQQLYKTNVVDEAKRQRDVDTKFILEGANRLQEARQYQQMYGKGSLYEKFKESQIEDLEASREAKKASRDYYTSELAKNQ